MNQATNPYASGKDESHRDQKQQQTTMNVSFGVHSWGGRVGVQRVWSKTEYLHNTPIQHELLTRWFDEND